MTLTEDFEEELSASLGERYIAKFIDDEELDSGELGLELEQTPLIARFHQLMNEAGRRNESNRETVLAGSEAESQTHMRLAGAAIAQSDDVFAGDNILAAREFENERLVERRDGGKFECVETLYDREASRTNAAFDHAPFTIDEFEFGEAQEEADMIKTFARRLRSDLFIITQEGRQFELAQMMREQNLRRRRIGWRRGGRQAAHPLTRTA